MPDIEITVGGRSFDVACQPGEEQFLRAAASALDREAQPLISQMGRLPEVRMLLMAGLMVADRTAALEEEVKALKAGKGGTGGAEKQKVEVPVVPESLRESLAEIAARAEALAEQIGETDD